MANSKQRTAKSNQKINLPNKFQLASHLLKNMGWRYFLFRLSYELKRRSGRLRKQYPTAPVLRQFITLAEWRKSASAFFFFDRSEINVEKKRAPQLEKMFEDFQKGKLRFFSSEVYEIGTDYDWLTNPQNGYRYDNQKHWTLIPDFSKEAGDIKWVWEKSRFSYLYGLIRYDYHFEKDLGETVFSEIDSWIAANPINQGPNWRCSQEISLRVLNWTFALYYYRNSEALTGERFQRIMHIIYWQLKHVAANINFSRIAVRNNHALTETLMLYLGGHLFPFFPEAKQWVEQGKKWFTEEIAYQIYEDGTFLQFSHNYHRVVIQLLSWAFYLSEAWEDRWSEVVYERARCSVIYLSSCMAGKQGELPNYGANDGAWFFPLSSTDYRDYRPSLGALYFYFNRNNLFDDVKAEEETEWYKQCLNSSSSTAPISLQESRLQSFEKGGYFLIRETDSLSFIKCGSYRDRPSHADNLHLDIWWKGENLLRDAGSFKYNTTAELISFFNGTRGHNTVGLGEYDQMKKGPRFIWLNWSKALEYWLKEEENDYLFYGRIKAFEEVGNGVLHERWVRKRKNKPVWIITDQFSDNYGLPMQQYWHPDPNARYTIHLSAKDAGGNQLQARKERGYYSGYYGLKTEAPVLVFETLTKTIKTEITIE